VSLRAMRAKKKVLANIAGQETSFDAQFICVRRHRDFIFGCTKKSPTCECEYSQQWCIFPGREIIH